MKITPSPRNLTNFQWDVVSLQPFDRGLTSNDGSDDVTKIRQYAEMVATRSPDVQIYLYAATSARTSSIARRTAGTSQARVWSLRWRRTRS